MLWAAARSPELINSWQMPHPRALRASGPAPPGMGCCCSGCSAQHRNPPLHLWLFGHAEAVASSWGKGARLPETSVAHAQQTTGAGRTSAQEGGRLEDGHDCRAIHPRGIAAGSAERVYGELLGAAAVHGCCCCCDVKINVESNLEELQSSVQGAKGSDGSDHQGFREVYVLRASSWRNSWS